MAQISDKARAAVERVFEWNPKATTEEFRKAAERADASIKGLAPRSFNASYVLPLKRDAATGIAAARKRIQQKGASMKKALGSLAEPTRTKRKVSKKAARKKEVVRKESTPAATKRGPGRPRKKTATKLGRPAKIEATKKAMAKKTSKQPAKKPGT